MNWMMECKLATLRLSSEIGWRPPDADTYVEPNLLICPRALKSVTRSPTDVLLAIEVAHSSLRFDATIKARLHAALGVRDNWVIDAETLTTCASRRRMARRAWSRCLRAIPSCRCWLLHWLSGSPISI